MTLCCIMGIVGASVLGGGNEIQDIVISNDLISDTFFTPMSFIPNVFADSSKVIFLFTHHSHMFNIRQTRHE